jgi:diaminohydroxyphosphoribosylaminopyrimidine deaminase / 5-amino-6-(5-phosphoribosylamino)uracil reductase
MSEGREADGAEQPKRPKVTLSWAQSADGRIATSSGESKYLSSPESLEVQQELRRDSDAVLVGLGTVLSDDPRLLCRLPPERNPAHRQPLRVVLDSRFAIPTDSVLARTAAEHPVLAIGALAPFRDQSSAGALGGAEERELALQSLGVQTARIPVVETGAALKLDLRSALALLADRGVRTLFVEGGGAILTSFLAEDLVDRVVLDLAPRFIGTGRNAVADLGVTRLAQARGFRSVAVALRGGNVVWTMER